MPREHTEFYEIDMENGWGDIPAIRKAAFAKFFPAIWMGAPSTVTALASSVLRLAPIETNPSSMIIGSKYFCLVVTL